MELVSAGLIGLTQNPKNPAISRGVFRFPLDFHAAGVGATSLGPRLAPTIYSCPFSFSVPITAREERGGFKR